MIIVQATIDGFGKWVDTTFRFSGSNVTCFYGNNESGKSTLQEFILYILFGLSPKKRKEYIPKNRSFVGGSLIVKDSVLGMMTIKRKEDEFTCLLADGSVKDEHWWKIYIHDLTRDVYTSVYAFSATDLSAIRTMNKQVISDVLFSIGLSGSTAIHDIERVLQKQLDALYKRRGEKPLLNQQITNVVKQHEQLNQAEHNEREYRPIQNDIEQLNHKQIKNKVILQEMQQELIKIERTKQLLPQIQLYHHHQDQIALYEVIIPFPSEGLIRYRELKEKVLPLKSEYQSMEKRYKECLDKVWEIHQKLVPNDLFHYGKDIMQHKSTYDFQRKEIDNFEKELHNLSEAYQSVLKELQWNQNETKGILLPFHLEATWQDIVTKNAKLREELEMIEQKNYVLKNRQAENSNEINKLTKQQLSADVVNNITEKLNADRLNIRNEQQKNHYHRWRDKQKKKSKGLLYACMGFAVLFFIIALFIEKPIIYVLSVVFVLAGGIQYLYAQNHTKVMDTIFTPATNHLRLAETERAQYRQQLALENDIQADLAFLKNEQHQLEVTLQQNSEKRQILEKREAQLFEEIDEEIYVYPFLRNVDVSNWPSLLLKVRELNELSATIEHVKKEKSILKGNQNHIESELKEFPYGSSFSELEAMIEEQSILQRTVNESNQDKEKLLKELNEMKETLDLYHAEIDELFKIAEVTSEDGFYKQARDVEEKQKLTEEMEQIIQQLHQFFPSVEVEELLQRDIVGTELDADLHQLKEKITELETSITHNNQLLAEMSVTIRQLEDSEDTSTSRLRFQTEKELLNDQANQWAVLKLAYGAIRQAKQTYQQKYLEDVLHHTSLFFHQLTDGAYHTVFPPSDTIPYFRVEGKQDIRYTVSELSQGTIDQLYISLRFAIAKVMSGSFFIPLLVDDAFVHFDGIRTEQAVNLLKEIGKEQQVIFFTCKQTISKLFSTVQTIEEKIEI